MADYFLAIFFNIFIFFKLKNTLVILFILPVYYIEIIIKFPNRKIIYNITISNQVIGNYYINIVHSTELV